MTTDLSKRFRTDSLVNVFAKDSFDRFGDDLTQVLLSYLTFEDKFRYECVSQQFQRVVYNKVFEVNVGHYRLSKPIELFHYKKRANIELFESVLKKCPNIRGVFATEDVVNEDEVFDAVIRNCNHLIEIESDFENLQIETFNRFCDKFWTTLRKINFIPNNSMVRQLLMTCPKVETFGYCWISLDEFFIGNKILVNRIKSFSFYYFPEDNQRISTFVKSNAKTLKTLEVMFYDNKLTANHTKVLYEELSQLSELKSLGMYFYVRTDTSFADYVLNLNEKYPKLTKIDFDLKLDTTSNLLKVFKSLNGFKHLKTIYLKNDSHLGHSSDDMYFLPIVSESIKDNKDLRHLRITGNSYGIKDEFFGSMNKYFPRLNRLYLTNADISDKAFNCLSKMSSLRSITLISLTLQSCLTESSVFQFIEKSNKIESIYLINSGFSADFTINDIEVIKEFSTHLRFRGSN